MLTAPHPLSSRFSSHLPALPFLFFRLFIGVKAYRSEDLFEMLVYTVRPETFLLVVWLVFFTCLVRAAHGHACHIASVLFSEDL